LLSGWLLHSTTQCAQINLPDVFFKSSFSIILKHLYDDEVMLQSLVQFELIFA